MKENPYNLFGPPTPHLRGRRKEWARLIGSLNRAVPEHVSLVGPRYIGKTVLLNALSLQLEARPTPFDGYSYWNLSDDRPQTDEGFYKCFGHYAARAVSGSAPEIREYLDSRDSSYETIKDAFAHLAENDGKILIVMDSLDNLLLAGDLTRNLWDSFRSLAELSSLRLVLSSQKRLREIVGSPEARTSPFWNLFADSILMLGPFDDQEDWSEMLAPFADRGIEFKSGARTELFNYSGGIPVLATAMCKRLWENLKDGTSVGDDTIRQLGSGFADEWRDLLADLWNDCDEQEQGVIHDLAHGRSLRSEDMSRDCLLRLTQRGFLRDRRGELKLCRTIEQYVNSYVRQTTNLRRLFGSSEEFGRNIGTVLRLRASQLRDIDETLAGHIKFSIEKLDQPQLFVTEIRGLVNRVFNIIWAEELPDRIIPAEWIAGWKQVDSEGNAPSYRVPDRFPTSGGGQRHLLNLMTDPRKAGQTRISRSTYLMLDYLQSIGDFGQHLGNSQVPKSFIHTVCFTSIELCEQLGAELPL